MNRYQLPIQHLRGKTSSTRLIIRAQPLTTQDLEVMALLLPLSLTFTHISLAGAQVSAEGAAILGTAFGLCTSLQELSLWDNHIGCAGTKAVCDGILSALERAPCESGPPGVEEPPKPHCLRVLSLAKNNVGDEGARAIAKLVTRFHGLESLDLCDNPRMTVLAGEYLGDALIQAYVPPAHLFMPVASHGPDQKRHGPCVCMYLTTRGCLNGCVPLPIVLCTDMLRPAQR